MWLRVEHELRLHYDGFVSQSRLELRVQPRTTVHQTLHSFSLAAGPPTRVHRYLDWNENYVHHFGVPGYHDRIEVTARSLVRTHPVALDLALASEPPPPRAALGSLLDFSSFEGPVVRSEKLEAMNGRIPVGANAPVGEQVSVIGDYLLSELRYETDVSHVKSSSDDLLDAGAGVCQDFAHLMLALLRLRGVPSRYVSGYLHTGQGTPAQSHAWIDVHTAHHGWVGYDPTHAQTPDERYVAVGWGRSYTDVPPNRGIYRGQAAESMTAEVRTEESVANDVVGLHEEISQLDVPVFRELPTHSRLDEPEESSDQQQQQQ